MTTETRTPTPLISTGVVQTLTTPADTVYFTPSGNKDMIVIASSSGTVKVTAVCQTECSMPLACTASPCSDAGLHNFVMSVTTGAGSPKAFIIPYIEHYISSTTGLVTLNVDVKANCTLGIFEMP